jgi:hypothetical protein
MGRQTFSLTYIGGIVVEPGEEGARFESVHQVSILESFGNFSLKE